MGLLLTMTWGGYESQDINIIEDLGLAYKSFRCDIRRDKRKFYILRDERWFPCNPVNPIDTFWEYINNNKKYVEHIIDVIKSHDTDGMVCF